MNSYVYVVICAPSSNAAYHWKKPDRGIPYIPQIAALGNIALIEAAKDLLKYANFRCPEEDIFLLPPPFENLFVATNAALQQNWVSQAGAGFLSQRESLTHFLSPENYTASLKYFGLTPESENLPLYFKARAWLIQAFTEETVSIPGYEISPPLLKQNSV